MPTGKPQSTIYGPLPTDDLQMANKQYVDLVTLRAVKEASETITSDDTVSNDTDLVVPLLANRRYGFLMLARVNSGVTPDFKYTFAAISNATGFYQNGALGSVPVSEVAFATTNGVGTNAGNQMLLTTGIVLMGSTDGNLQYQWSQLTSNGANTTLLEGSFLIAWLLD